MMVQSSPEGEFFFKKKRRKNRYPQNDSSINKASDNRQGKHALAPDTNASHHSLVVGKVKAERARPKRFHGTCALATKGAPTSHPRTKS
jgi:hypothetical protein